MSPIGSQMYGLCVMVLTGIAVGLVLDIYRGIRIEFRPGPILTAIGDLAFWGMATAVVFLGLLFATWGEVRLYCVLGLTCGLVLYRAMAASVILSLVTSVAKFLHGNVLVVTRGACGCTRLVERLISPFLLRRREG